MNRSLARSLLVGVTLLIVAFLLHAACVPLGPWQSAVVSRTTASRTLVRGPAFVWAVPFFTRVRVFDRRVRTVTGAASWKAKATETSLILRGTLVYTATWRVTNPLRYVRLGTDTAARHTIAAYVRGALERLLETTPAKTLLTRSNLAPELKGLSAEEARSGVTIVSVRPETLRWNASVLNAYVARRKKALAVRLSEKRRRDAVVRALLAAREDAERARILIGARRRARLERARVRARALAQEIAVARSAPSFFASLVRLEILDRALSPPLPATRPRDGAATH
jgi:regulator of protease activity HflC (stomatin/prohibitin superfamily)